MAIPSLADTLADRLEPWLNDDFQAYFDAIAAMVDPLLQVISDDGIDGDPGYVPGYGVLLDPDACPLASLPYLGQFVGVAVTSSADDTTARSLVKAEAGISRGTEASIIAAAARNLTGTQTVNAFWRTAADGTTKDPYHFVLVVAASECPDAAALTTAVDAVKPGGLMWTLIQTGSWTIAQFETTYASISTAEAAFSTVTHLETDQIG